jgi:hypothetical protein
MVFKKLTPPRSKANNSSLNIVSHSSAQETRTFDLPKPQRRIQNLGCPSEISNFFLEHRFRDWSPRASRAAQDHPPVT